MKFNQRRFSEDLRLARGDLTLRCFGEDIGISASTICRIENGKLPDIETFATVCEVLKWSPEAYFIDSSWLDFMET